MTTTQNRIKTLQDAMQILAQERHRLSPEQIDGARNVISRIVIALEQEIDIDYLRSQQRKPPMRVNRSHRRPVKA